jgi:hypothetical protein
LLLVGVGLKKQVDKREETADAPPSFSVRFKNAVPQRGYVFEGDATLPGGSVVSLAATTPCRLQQYTLLGVLASSLMTYGIVLDELTA